MNLKKYLKIKNKSIRQAAGELGFVYEDVRRYVNMGTVPRPERMSAIFKWSGGEVTANDFYTADEEEKGDDGNC